MPEWVGVNASPLIVLAKIGRPELLNAAGNQLVTTSAVMRELCQPGTIDPVYTAVRGLSWLAEVPDPPLSPEVTAANLGPGESSLVAWGLQDTQRELILDDLEARLFARRHGITTGGTLAVVIAAKRAGRIVTARPVFQQLRGAGLYVSDKLFNGVLQTAGE